MTNPIRARLDEWAVLRETERLLGALRAVLDLCDRLVDPDDTWVAEWVRRVIAEHLGVSP